MSCNTTHTSGHLTHLISESIKASIHVLKLHHNCLERHSTRRRRRSRSGWSGMGERSHRLDPWLLRLKLGLTLSNSHCANGTLDGEMRRLEIRDRVVVNDPRDRRRKDKLITGHCILTNIYKGEYKVRGKVNSKVLDEGKQKASMRLNNRIIMRQEM